MSIFPAYAKCRSAPHKQGAGAGAAASAANSTKHKEHRFDKLAKRIAANMITAIRVSLSVFSSPDKERWPATQLLDFLKGAEDLAREMLREIALKIFISPVKLRKRSKQGEVTSATNRAEYAPYFRLEVKAKKLDSPEEENAETLGRSPEHSEPEGHTSNAQAQRPGKARIAASKFKQRLAALEDVLAHPGKHGARMSRALYREAHGGGERLVAMSEDDVLITCANRMCDASADVAKDIMKNDFPKIMHLFDDSG